MTTKQHFALQFCAKQRVFSLFFLTFTALFSPIFKDLQAQTPALGNGTLYPKDTLSTASKRYLSITELDGITPAEDSIYLANMKQGINIMDKAMDIGQLAQAALFFEDTADEYPHLWLPVYYAAYCYSLMAFLEKNLISKDNYLDNAQQWVERAGFLNTGNVEILIVQALIYQERVQVNPAERMSEYGTMNIITLENAEKLDPNNPRIYYLRAQNMFLTPEIAGGGLQKACPLVEIAAQKYTAQKFDPESIQPKWGAAMTEYMLQICNYGKK